MVLGLALFPYSQDALGSNAAWGLSVWGFHVFIVSACVLSRYSSFLPHFKDMHRVRLIGECECEWLPGAMCL